MWLETSLIIYLIIFFISFLFYINYLYNLLIDIEHLFKYDFTKKNNKIKKNEFEKLSFILKNNHLFFLILCCLQTVISIFNGSLIDQLFLKLNLSFNIVFSIVFSILLTLTTDFLSRYIANNTKNLVFNIVFLNSVYYTLKFLQPFFLWIAVPRDNLLTNSESDMYRFINNLTLDNILEKKEAKLVQSALAFDDIYAFEVNKRREDTAFLLDSMDFDSIKQIYINKGFTRYPVFRETLGNKRKIIGVLDLKKLFFFIEYNNIDINKNKFFNWKQCIDFNFFVVDYKKKLDYILDKFKNNGEKIAILVKKNHFYGIITQEMLFNVLIGKFLSKKNNK